MDTACLAVIASKAGAVASSPEDDPRFSSGCRDALAAHRAALAINPTLDNALMAECRDTVQSEPFVAFCQKAFPKATPPLPPLLVTSCLRKLRAAGRLGEGCSLQVQRLQSDEARDMTLDARLFAACEAETKGEGPCASVAAGGGRLRACLEKEAAAQKAPPAMCTGADLGPSRGLLAPAFALALAPATGTGPWRLPLAPDPTLTLTVVRCSSLCGRRGRAVRWAAERRACDRCATSCRRCSAARQPARWARRPMPRWARRWTRRARRVQRRTRPRRSPAYLPSASSSCTSLSWCAPPPRHLHATSTTPGPPALQAVTTELRAPPQL